MDPATAAAGAYGLETAIEAGVATYYLAQPTLPLKATLQHISSPTSTPRSSHTLSVVGDKAYIFGGTSQDEKESSNDIEELHILNEQDNVTGTVHPRLITAIGENGDTPQSRTQHSATVARNRIFVFGGRDVTNSQVLEEDGRIWGFDPLNSNWLFLDPPPHTAFPCSRYLHAGTSNEEGSAIFVHGGISTGGERLGDTWAFYLDEGKWTRLGNAKGRGRSGVGIACCKGKLWRFGGFDGERMGGELEVLEVVREQSIDGPGVLDVSKREWEIISRPSEEGGSSSWPAARSMAALHYVTTGNGRDYLILALGGDPEAESKNGMLLQDIWAYQLPSSGMSGARVKDAIRDKVPGVKTHEGQWALVDITKMKVGEDEKSGGAWTGRSGFGSSMTGTKQFLLWGGVDGHGEALGDGWWIKIE